MKSRIGWALVAALSLWATAVCSQTIGADGQKAQTLGMTRVGGIASDSTQHIFKTDANGYLKADDPNRDRDLDYYATVISTASLDTAASLWSGPIDLRKYSRFTVIVHITPGVGAADTTYAGLYDFGLTMYAPPVLAIDWTGYGMPVVTRQSGGRSAGTFAGGAPDTTAGFFQTNGFNSQTTCPGERLLRLRGSAPLLSTNKNYVNRNFTQTVRIPGSDLLGPGDRPRFAVFQIRGMARASTNAPSVRVDIEALR